jgi:hypothetical protein
MTFTDEVRLEVYNPVVDAQRVLPIDIVVYLRIATKGGS